MHRLLVLALLGGCVPTTYAWTPASNKPTSPRPESCPVEVLAMAPDDGYEEVGTLAHYNGKLPRSDDDFKRAVAKQVCGTGGDAVVAQKNDKGEYIKGTVIKYDRRPESPAAP
jgi:hypothetical protein